MPDNNDMTAGADAPAIDNANPIPTGGATLSDVPTDEVNAPRSDNVAAMPMEIAARIAESKNVLVALSADPSVDEMAAAIGLTLYLDKLGKRATAIYSGETPNALEFLKPEETFEKTVDSLQDFVIALNKDKADHLRYKLDGEFVKIYITPYKSKITEGDLDFSYGDFNVDLVLALDVANGVDLDTALREHGRIMHDATIINITNGSGGKLAEIEWNDRNASSVSEMIAKMIYEVRDVLTKDGAAVSIDKDIATAFLTGIVAATDRFSNAVTKPETMRLASQLMESGANQQLISKNITPEISDKLLNRSGAPSQVTPEQLAATQDANRPNSSSSAETRLDVGHPGATNSIDPDKAEPEDLKVSVDVTPDKKNEPKVEVATSNNDPAQEVEDLMREAVFELKPEDKKEKIAPRSEPVVSEPSLPPLPMPPVDFGETGGETFEDLLKKEDNLTTPNEAMANLPKVQPITPATPVEEPKPAPLGAQPAMQDQVYRPQAADPGAFKIPGM